MKSVLVILLTVLCMSVDGQADRKYVRKGNGNYKDGKYQEAEVEYRKALEKDTTSFRAGYNLGNALYRQQQFDAAAGRYSALIENYPGHAEPGHAEKSRSMPVNSESNRSIDETLSRYYYNLGNTFYKSQKYKESIEAYKQSLRNNPSDLDAKHNLQMALKMMQQQQQQQQKNNQEGNNDQQKNQPEDQKQDQKEKDQKEQGQENNPDQKQADAEPRKGEISPEDAERILQALENEEKEVMKEVQDRKEKARKIPVEKNW